MVRAARATVDVSPAAMPMVVEVPGQRVRPGAFVHAHLSVLYLAGAALMALMLRLHGITDKSIWYDEAFVITLAQMSIPDLIRALIQLDPHPPLYYVLMHFWLLLGTDPLMARLPSALLSTATVPLLYATGARLAGRRVALGAATLLVFSPFHVFWAQEIRMYALLGLVCLGSTYFLVRALQERDWAWWGLHALLTAAAFYTHLGAVFYLAAQGAAILWLCSRRRVVKGAAIPWAASQLAAIALMLPWVPAMLQQSTVYGPLGFARTTPASLLWVLSQFTYYALPYWHLHVDLGGVARDALVVLSVLVAVAAAWSLRRRLAGVLLPCLFLGPVALLALMGLWQGVVLPKVVLPASFGYYLLVAAGLALWRRRAVLVGGIAVVVLLNLAGLAHYYTEDPVENWRTVATHLEQGYQVGDVALSDSGAGLMPLNYYLQQDGRPIEVHGVPARPWAVAPPSLTQEDFRQVDELIAGKSAVWLVIYRNGSTDAEGQVGPYLSARFELAEEWSAPPIRLLRFVPRAPERSATAPGPVAATRPSGPATGAAAAAAGEAAHVYFGAWVGERVNIPGDTAAFERAVGTGLAIVNHYSDNPPYYGLQFDSAWADSVRAGGSIPMLTWQPGFGKGTRSLASVASGERDSYLVTWADQIRDWGHPLFFRMMIEQNAAWFSWRADREPLISDYIAAWRHIVDVFRERGVTNATFVWSPHVPGNGASAVMPTYPGDDYVDWVALDGYPFRGGRGDFVDTFGEAYDLLAREVSKPIMIAETSLDVWSDEQKAGWIHQILGQNLPNRFPLVKALVWFDEKNTDGIHYSVLEGSGPLSREAFRQELDSPYYASNWYGDLDVSPIPPPEELAAVHPPSAAPPPAAPPPDVPPSDAPSGEVPPAAPPSPGVAENLLVDPGFEEGDGAGGWGPAWVVPPWVARLVQRDGAAAASGSFSMLHSSGGGETYAVYQEVPVVAGARYDLSVLVKVEDALRYGKATLQVRALNQYGGGIETRPVAVWQDATEGWTPVAGSVTMPRGATRARIEVQVTSLRGTFRLDDFSFMRSGE